MLFNSLIFLFVFFPIFLLIYFLTPHRYKNFIILIGSLFFYTWGETIYVTILLLSIFVDFFASQLISKGYKRFGLSISLIFNLGLLFFFKYADFTFININNICTTLNIPLNLDLLKLTLPLGISFFTFQTMSYTMDVYFGKIKASNNIINFATYVTMFPQLIAGPIVRYREIKQELEVKNLSPSHIQSGIHRFIIGLAKKVLIANTLAVIADDIFKLELDQVSSLWCWVAIICYSLQIYYDFSGYSDMAIGIGRVLGFNFPENFNLPYISKSIREFWTRWHMTLSRWFKDYLYIPLGGNRKGKSRTYINLLIVFVITAFWHGASWNFLIWGLIHGLFIILEKSLLKNLLTKAPSLVKHIYVLLIVIIAWVFFRSETLSYGIGFCTKLFSFDAGDPSVSSYLNFFHLTFENIFFLVLSLMLSSSIIHTKLINDLFLKFKQLRFSYLITNTVLMAVFILCLSFIAAGTYNPFIYFRF